MFLTRLLGLKPALPPDEPKISDACTAVDAFLGRSHREGIDRVAVGKFDHRFAVVEPFTTSRSLASAALARIEREVLGGQGGGTALYDGVVQLGEAFADAGRPAAAAVAAILTDGRDEHSVRFKGDPAAAGIAYRRAMGRCRCAATLTVLIGVGPDVNTAALATLARHGDMKLVAADRMSQLGHILYGLGTQLGQGVEITRVSDGHTTLTVADRVLRANILPYDVAVLVDASGSMANRG